MRIQQTDQILKEARNARHATAKHPDPSRGFIARIWSAVTNLFK